MADDSRATGGLELWILAPRHDPLFQLRCESTRIEKAVATGGPFYTVQLSRQRLEDARRRRRHGELVRETLERVDDGSRRRAKVRAQRRQGVARRRASTAVL